MILTPGRPVVCVTEKEHGLANHAARMKQIYITRAFTATIVGKCFANERVEGINLLHPAHGELFTAVYSSAIVEHPAVVGTRVNFGMSILRSL